MTGARAAQLMVTLLLCGLQVAGCTGEDQGRRTDSGQAHCQDANRSGCPDAYRAGLTDASQTGCTDSGQTRCQDTGRDQPAVVDTLAVDVGPACGPGETLCGATCVRLPSDIKHCGKCGNSCGVGNNCLGGTCMVAHDINHVLCTGQSLSYGAAGVPVLSLSQPVLNRMFNTGVLAGGKGLKSFVPLMEGKLESMSSGMANLVTQMARFDLFKNRAKPLNSHDLLISCHGAAKPYSLLKKDSVPYANGMIQVQEAMAISQSKGLTYAVRGVTVVHGESDHSIGNKNYDQDILAWQSSYEKDVNALTKRTGPLPMFYTQMSGWSFYNSATSSIPVAQLKAHLAKPDRMILVGPKYHLPYADGLHLTNHGYRWMGEYYAKVYRRVVLEGKTWTPLRPDTITRAGDVVTVKFLVPVPPLKLDTQRVSNPGACGFEFWDNSSASPSIKAVQVTGPTTVTITLSKTPAGTARRLRYAYSAKPKAAAGPKTGARGNLRDSDATVSRHGYALYNWAVHFDVPVP